MIMCIPAANPPSSLSPGPLSSIPFAPTWPATPEAWPAFTHPLSAFAWSAIGPLRSSVQVAAVETIVRERIQAGLPVFAGACAAVYSV